MSLRKWMKGKFTSDVKDVSDQAIDFISKVGQKIWMEDDPMDWSQFITCETEEHIGCRLHSITRSMKVGCGENKEIHNKQSATWGWSSADGRQEHRGTKRAPKIY